MRGEAPRLYAIGAPTVAYAELPTSETSFLPACHAFMPSSQRRRRVSMATASALEDLAPMQRRDSMARKMTKMFKTPDTHAAFLTSSRFALDLIKVTYSRLLYDFGTMPQGEDNLLEPREHMIGIPVLPRKERGLCARACHLICRP